MSEQAKARQEACCNASETEYFGARSQIDTLMQRHSFCAGFYRGYAAAIAAAPAQPVQSSSICIECRNADSWGLPDKHCCSACISGSNWEPLNKSSVNPNKVVTPQADSQPAPTVDDLPREDFAWLVVQEACETEPSDEDDQECIRILRLDLKSAVLAAFLRHDAARAQADSVLEDAARDVLAERQRQIGVEGWTPEHDDEHECGDMARAAACYLLVAAGYPSDDVAILRFWPWLDAWWKPTDQRRDLVKAGALILAEIERIDRAARKQGANHD